MWDPVEILYSKDTSEAHEKFKLLELECETCPELSEYFEEYLNATQNKNSCVRGRAFRLIMHMSKWDKEDKIRENFERITEVLDDEKGTVVRRCLAVVHKLAEYKPELVPAVREKLLGIDLTKHKESMRPLISKDILAVVEHFDVCEKTACSATEASVNQNKTGDRL